MEAHENSELIEHQSGDKSKNRSALTISILAMVLAIASLGGSNAMKEATHENILAANTYSFYQAKTIRQTSLKIAATDLEIQLLSAVALPASTREVIQKKSMTTKIRLIAMSQSRPPKRGKKNCWRVPKRTRKPATTRCNKTLGSITLRACCKSPLSCFQSQF